MGCRFPIAMTIAAGYRQSADSMLLDSDLRPRHTGDGFWPLLGQRGICYSMRAQGRSFIKSVVEVS